MKQFLLLIFMAVSAVLSGQTEDNNTRDSILYLTDKQEAFMIDKETKYLIKTGPIGFERKLTQSFSLNAILQPSLSNWRMVETGVELRYYYKIAKLIKEGKQADNMSSEYFSAGVGYEGLSFFGDGVDLPILRHFII